MTRHQYGFASCDYGTPFDEQTVLPFILSFAPPRLCVSHSFSVRHSLTYKNTNSSCQTRSTRVSVRGSLMFSVVHFMYPTKHWLLGRVHAVHHEIDQSSIRSLATRTSFETGNVFTNDDLCNVRKEAISSGVENAQRRWGTFSLPTRFDTNRTEPTTCSRVYKIRNQDLGRFDFKIRKRQTPKSSNLQILKWWFSV